MPLYRLAQDVADAAKGVPVVFLKAGLRRLAFVPAKAALRLLVIRAGHGAATTDWRIYDAILDCQIEFVREITRQPAAGGKGINHVLCEQRVIQVELLARNGVVVRLYPRRFQRSHTLVAITHGLATNFAECCFV